MRLNRGITVLLIIMFCLGSFVPCEAQNKNRRKEPEKQNESEKLSYKIVSDECVSEEESEECFSDASAPKPDTSWKPKGSIMISDCVPMVIKDVSYPKVCYPKIAQAARASGTVKIEVVIDEKGNVIWARAVKGHPLLRLAALRAACRTRIKPIIDCQGQAVKVNIFLYFTFKLS